jgi:cytochrome c oxidase cbb3-type subunit 4
MDVNTLRMSLLVIGLTIFLGLVVWAWSRNRKADFDAAAALPFNDEVPREPASSSTAARGGQA